MGTRFERRLSLVATLCWSKPIALCMANVALSLGVAGHRRGKGSGPRLPPTQTPCCLLAIVSPVILQAHTRVQTTINRAIRWHTLSLMTRRQDTNISPNNSQRGTVTPIDANMANLARSAAVRWQWNLVSCMAKVCGRDANGKEERSHKSHGKRLLDTLRCQSAHGSYSGCPSNGCPQCEACPSQTTSPSSSALRLLGDTLGR